MNIHQIDIYLPLVVVHVGWLLLTKSREKLIMKKEDVVGFIVYLLAIGLAMVFCFTVLKKYAETDTGMNNFAYWLYIVGAALTGILLNSILYELAHVAGAKVGRYGVSSVCVLGFTFLIGEEGKKFKFGAFNGLTGETKIYPKADAEKEPNPRPFLLFGTLFYIIELALVITLFIVLNSLEQRVASNIAYFLLTIAVVGGVILFYNILPFKLDSVTDGYRLTMISNPKNKEAFNELLRVEHEIAQGNTDVEIKTFDEITNFTADLNLNKVYALLDERKYEEAEVLLDGILNNPENVSNKVFLRARAQKLYIHLMNEDISKAKEYYEKEVDLKEIREISRDVSMPSIRTYILISGLLDKSRSETEITLRNVDVAYRRTPEKRKKVEMQLYNEALNKVIQAHPDWEELPNFILVDKKEEKKASN